MTSPLSLSQWVRDLWGRYDASVIAQLAPLAEEKCYQPKFYKAPAIGQEVMSAKSYVPYGLKITPGSIVYGLYLPCLPATNAPPQFSVQITDQSLEHSFWSEAIPSNFIANSLGTCQSVNVEQKGSFPHLLSAPYPVTGEGLFLVELWETSGAQQRIELVMGVFEAVGE